ncbi:MAG: HAD family phosphatase, partial [Clostridia bacterium]|nr:HAD family phosphatase [Clostridia bacterium]
MKSIVFDMDGVLFDTEKVYFEAWHRVAEEMQLDVEEVLLLCAGHNAADIAVIFDNYYGGKVSYAEFGPKKTAAFHEIIKERGLPEKEGLHEILDFLKKEG